jgi:hypothetical protein
MIGSAEIYAGPRLDTEFRPDAILRQPGILGRNDLLQVFQRSGDLDGDLGQVPRLPAPGSWKARALADQHCGHTSEPH